VWTGAGLGALTPGGCGTPGPSTSTAVNVSSGTTYFIRVGSSNGVGSNFTVQAAVSPANDDFANAIDITTGFAGFSNTQDVIGASVETTDQAATCSGAAFRSVWYKYTALGSNVLTVDTATSNFDTVLSIWTGVTPGALTQVGCNDDFGGPTTSRLVLNTTAGLTYFIRVGSKGGSPTNLTFTMAVATIPNAAPLRNFFTAGDPTLTWNLVTNATGYIVQVSKSQTFAGTPVVTSPTLPSTQLFWQITPTLTQDGVYYWRVSANGGTTWSAGDSFVLDLP